MKTTAILTLDTRRSKKDGTFPLIYRLRHSSSTLPIKTGIFLREKDWNEDTRKINKSYKGASSITRLNNQLQKRQTKYYDKIIALFENEELSNLSAMQLRDILIGNKEKAYDFFSYSDFLISNLKKSGRFGNAGIYKTTSNILKTFINRKELPFREINYSFLKKFETYHLAKGNSWNSLSVYLRTVRAIYNQAIAESIINKEFYPFDKYKIKNVKTQKRAISNSDLKKILNLKLEKTHESFHARNYFIISYMMYGINFIDLANLKMENIIENRIHFKRRKTGKEYSIKINEQLKEILNYYIAEKEENQFIFPIIKRKEKFKQYQDTKWALARYNKQLKKIAKLCLIETNLTSYVSRHSFATQAMLKDIPLTAISEMMGHARINTTQIYLKALPNEILDDYNEDIVNL